MADNTVGVPGRILAFLVEDVGWTDVDDPADLGPHVSIREPVVDEGAEATIFRSGGAVMVVDNDRIMGVKYADMVMQRQEPSPQSPGGKKGLRGIKGGGGGGKTH